MAENGIRTTNLPAGALDEVLGHISVGGTRTVGRQAVGDFTNRMLAFAGMEPSALAELQGVVADHGGRIGNLDGAVTDHTGALANYGTAITDHTRRIGTLESTATGQEPRLLAVISSARDTADALRLTNATALRHLVADRFRPGETPAAYTRSANGGPPEGLPVFDGLIVDGPAGKAVQFRGEDLLVSREYVRIEPGRLYGIRSVLRRIVDAVDPSNDTVRCVAQLYDRTWQPLTGGNAFALIEDVSDLTAASGTREVDAVLCTVAAANVTVTVPADAAYFRLAVRSFGGDQRTNVDRLGWVDVTDLDLYSPDLSGLLSRLTGIESQNLPARTGALEQAAGTPGSSTFASRLAAQGGTMPVSSTVLRLLGFTDPGDGGGGDWIEVPAEPAHAMKVKVGTRWFAFGGAALNLLQAGGADDDADASRARNADALFRASTYLGTTARKTLRLPNRLTGRYRLPTATAVVLDGITLDPDPDVRIQGNFVPGDNLRVTREIWIDFTDGATSFSYPLSPTWGRPAAEKSLWINHGDLPRREISDVDAYAGMTHEMVVWPASDAWAADTTVVAGSSNSSRITRNLINDGRWHVSWLPARGGDRITWAFSDFAGQRGAFVRTTAGFFLFYSNDTGTAFYAYKRPGQAAVISGGLDWAGRSTLQSQQPRYSRWSIRVYDYRRWVVLLNGVEVTLPQDIAQGEIIQAGAALYGDQALSDVTIENVVRIREREAAGKAPIRILCEGDSTMASIFGALTGALKEALDGSCGIRVFDIINRAVVGNNSGDMATRIAGLGAGGANYAILKIGRNDIQGGTASVDISIANISGAIDKLAGEFCVPILCIPGQWYGQAQVSGAGTATTNYERGARLRAAMLRLAAIKGIPWYEEDLEQGLILPVYLATPDATEQRLRDNIHQTNTLYRIDGYNLARVLADHYLRPMTSRLPSAPLATAAGPNFGPVNAWGAGAGTYRVSADGIVSLGGFITPPVGFAGNAGAVTIHLLPPNARPKVVQRIQARCFGGGVPLDVQPDGSIVVTGAAGTVSFVVLDGISYEAA